ncbi:MAG: hypothetical protein CME43_04180 [Haliea sp.]|uniref:glycosyltransferase family 2 protein n=1 Tax=Haliea sp. TaxID=1932666 RepID=UPI000C60F830|nr:glycosyltransferase family A protein [Haliea sp.]MBM68659.1 hypothetical protein [Haliea sp.]|tara:strand:+ start:494 stop:1333 length:840 start_codon:yes stop_codon:yes gene_type:complete
MTEHTAAGSSSVCALLPAWQAAEFIQPTLESLSAQTYRNFRVIVSVDQCTDDTAELCRAHAEGDPRFRVVQQSERLGYVGNCNALLQLADSDYAMFAFHDDIIAPTYIERLAAALDGDPEAVVSFSDVHLTHTDGREEHWVLSELEGIANPAERGHLMLAGGLKWWVPNRGVFRLSMARQIGGLKLHGAGEFSTDWPWLFHMSLLGKFLRVPETLCFKYYKPGSLSRSWAFTPEQRFEVLCACLRELWNANISSTAKLDIAVPLVQYLHHNRPQGVTAA